MRYKTVEPEYERRFMADDIAASRKHKERANKALLRLSSAAVKLSFMGVGGIAIALLWMAQDIIGKFLTGFIGADWVPVVIAGSLALIFIGAIISLAADGMRENLWNEFKY